MVTNLRLSVVIWPDPKSWADINMIRQRYDAHYQYVGPHITIAFPDKVDASVEAIKAGIAEAAAAVQPFTAVFDRWVSATELLQSHPDSTRFLIDRYPNAVNLIVLLASQGAEQMLTLRRAFDKIIPQPPLLLEYPIYMTLGQTLTDEQAAQARAELADYEPNYHIPVTSFDLLAEQPDGTWPLLERFQVGR